MKIKRFFLILVTLLCVFNQLKYIHAEEFTSSGFYYPLKTDNPTFTKCGRWLERCPPNGCYKLYDLEGNLLSRYHIGVDMMITEGKPVYAISDGQVKEISSGGWGSGNVALIIEHKTITGKIFKSIYGHIRNTKKVGDFVKAGERIGEIGNWYGTGDHLHWGILNPGLDGPLGAGFGAKPDSEYGQPKGNDNIYDDGLIDPFWFIAHNAPDNYLIREEMDSSSLSFPIQPTNPYFYQLCIDKYPIDSRCDLGYLDSFISCVYEDSSLCVPEGYSAYGLGASSHVPGIGAAGGDGVLPEPGEEPKPGLPDFTESGLKLMDNNGNERYVYYLYDDEIEMHHWSTNIGQADWAGTEDDIYVRFYLSKGYKARNSDDDWVRVGSEQIQKGNLNIGTIKHEWTKLNLNEYLNNGYLEVDHVYNIVVCIDQDQDVDNGDGEVPEVHESNNCTTEAVFLFKESSIPTEELHALVALFDSTNGLNWKNNSGWKTKTDPCSWYGVGCEIGHVVGINLPFNQLNGTITQEIGNLTKLRILNLYENQLSGSIPTEIGNLVNLTSLLLGSNYGSNQLSGSIPVVIGNLHNLTNIDLRENLLTGPIPSEIGNLVNLTELALSGNQLSGSIPPEIGNLVSIPYLDLYDNQLSGSIPPEIGNLTNLTALGLTNNQLSGAIPAEIGNLVNLELIEISNNQLSGSIPTELGNLTNLYSLWLDRNQLSGPIPSEFGNMDNLAILNLSDNQLSGLIPPEIGNMTNLTHLWLRNNQLSGSIPAQIVNLTNLLSLSLGMNQLSGAIPSGIGSLVNLEEIDLSYNQLSGSLPKEIGNLTNILRFDIGLNQLDGSIPIEIGNLINLTSLWLGGNQLSGSIPPEVGNLVNLTNLNLSNNQLSGSIPPEIGNLVNLISLYLSTNQLTGNIPVKMDRLVNLEYFHANHNQLTGMVPLSVAKIKNCDLENNAPFLCVPNTVEYQAIGLESICGLPLSSSCNLATAPVSAFVAAPTSGSAPLSVAFTDQSTGTVASWAWDFDSNGSVDATVPNPSHLYNAAGSYTVTLTVNGPAGSDTVTKTGYIVVGPVLDADNDTIPDNWEEQWFGNTTTAGGSTDWDRDGYSDLQEYLNQQQAENDPLGAAYDPKTANAPGGTGYIDPGDSFWEIMTPVIINNARSVAPETK